MIEKEHVKIDENGELISADIVTLKRVSPEEFCQIYLKNNDVFFRLNKAESNLLGFCWYYSVYYTDVKMECPGNQIVFNKQIREIAKDKTGLSEGTIRNTLVSLVEKEMLLKDDKFRGVYYLNPRFFFKGRIGDRTKLIKQVVNYEILNNDNK
jgi:hypothetical protein